MNSNRDDTMMNFSIIIPHKNTPELLQRCLDSIPDREDLQIIVVDDNSDSKIVDFKNFPGKNRNNIDIYYTKDNKGAGYARNYGMRYAKGKWLLFADADDYYTDSIDSFLEKYKNDTNDCIYFKISAEERKGTSQYLNDLVDSFLNDTDRNLLRYQSYTPWCKMVKRNLIMDNNILFDEVLSANDVGFSVRVGYYAKSIMAVNDIVYYYSYCKSSLIETKDAKNFTDRIKVIVKTNNFLAEHDLLQYKIQGISWFLGVVKRNDFLQYIKMICFCLIHSSNKIRMSYLVVIEDKIKRKITHS